MVLAHHILISAYGFWLPNDPRGSWSTWIRKWELLRYGPATKVDTHRSVAAKPHDRRLRIAAKRALNLPPVTFTGRQALAVAEGFKRAIDEAGYQCLACAILPQHVHLVMLRHARPAETMIKHLKARASLQLRDAGLHPFAEHETQDGTLPSPWGHKGWKVFLDSPADIHRAVEYVENNPLKEGKPRQRWSFVTAYRG